MELLSSTTGIDLAQLLQGFARKTGTNPNPSGGDGALRSTEQG